MARTVLSSDCSGPALTPISELIYGRQARLSDRQLTPRRASVLRPLYADRCNLGRNEDRDGNCPIALSNLILCLKMVGILTNPISYIVVGWIIYWLCRSGLTLCTRRRGHYAVTVRNRSLFRCGRFMPNNVIAELHQSALYDQPQLVEPCAPGRLASHYKTLKWFEILSCRRLRTKYILILLQYC